MRSRSLYLSHKHTTVVCHLNANWMQLSSKTVLFRIISIVCVPSLFSNIDNIRNHDDEFAALSSEREADY